MQAPEWFDFPPDFSTKP